MPPKKRSKISQSSNQAKRKEAREKKKDAIAEESPEATSSRQEHDRERTTARRSEETPAETAARLADQAQRTAAGREEETPEETAARLADQAQRTAAGREEETPEERAARLADKAQRTAAGKEHETPEERDARLLEKRRQSAENRAEETPEAANQRRQENRDVLNGAQLVPYNQLPDLFQADGTPTAEAKVCPHCHAVKWKDETEGMCCMNGKVKFEEGLFDDQPEVYKALWEGEGGRRQQGEDKMAKAQRLAPTLRKYARQVNNALSLACLIVEQRRLPGDNPSVIIQGKVHVKLGPLRAHQGQQACFAQLFVLDPDHSNPEEEERLGTMRLPEGTSEAEKTRLKEILHLLQTELRQSNPYVQDFQFAFEILDQDHPQTVKLFIDETKRPQGEHARRFNAGFKEISVLFGDEKHEKQWLAIRNREGGLKEIEDTHRSADPLRFTILFPTGKDGWHIGIPKNCDYPQGARMTPREFYAFQLQLRYQPGKIFSTTLFRAQRLFQEYLCLAQAKVENQRLKYIENHQKELRGDKYNRLAEDVYNHRNSDPSDPERSANLRAGKQVILPPSFTGGPRYMHSHYLDGMAILRDLHKPDIFTTETCDPACPEIKKLLLPGQQPRDRPDLIARVFRLKQKQLADEVFKDSIFGNSSGYMWVNESQKRGLPHMHHLSILEEQDRLHTADDVDEVICAELPPDPKTFPEGSDQRKQAERLEKLVLEKMVHSCSSQCLDERKRCKKRFPKPFSPITEWNEDAFYPKYRRRSKDQGGRVIMHKGKEITNAYVVPYNPYLLLRYEQHINVEACASPTAAKYLFKYITKGPDRAMARMDCNEVQEYQNYRSIGSSEAAWRLLNFPITDRYPAVKELRCHLPNQDYVVFREGEEAAMVEQGSHKTELTEFFTFNKANHVDRKTGDKYVDFPKNHVYDQKNKIWKIRERGGTIGRIHSIHPLSGDEFYLRMLLHHDHCRGSTSFEDLRTLDGVLCDTYKDVCRKLGLLRDDNEWDETLKEAAVTKLSPQLRSLFVTILLFCEPSQPRILFEQHYEEWMDDFKRKRANASASPEALKTMVLLDIEKMLQTKDKELSDFGLPAISNAGMEEVQELQVQDAEENMPVLLREELDFDFDACLADAYVRQNRLRPSQREVFIDVLKAVEEGRPFCAFIDARGGTGKTYTLNAILSAGRTLDDLKNVCLAVATSGIAAILLNLGRTFHSRFKAPLRADEYSTLCIRPTDLLAKVIKDCKLIVWDEAPMAHRYLMEAMDRSLRDITQVQQPFGGKVLVLAGDFRQCLPVIPHGSRAEIVGAALTRSHLWKHFKVYTLEENMRIGNDPALQHHDKWLLDLGNGDIQIKQEPDLIKVPDEFIFEINDDSYEALEESKRNFVETIFPNMKNEAQEESDDWIMWIAKRAILVPKNAPADRINQMIFNDFDGEPHIKSSADSTADIEDATRFPVEYLNSLTPQGLPPHRLFLKNKMILLLMRNLDKLQGLCNGTRLILERVGQYVLHCKIATEGDKQFNEVLIPRIELTTTDGDFPFKWKRRQYPLRPAFAMTVNKSQGQTLKDVGAWLEEPVFTHGQLYVSASRNGDPANLHMAIKKSHDKLTRNVVYKEVFNHH